MNFADQQQAALTELKFERTESRSPKTEDAIVAYYLLHISCLVNLLCWSIIRSTKEKWFPDIHWTGPDCTLNKVLYNVKILSC